MAGEIGPDGLVVGRSCGSCSLCCKVFKVDWLDRPKPAGKWCHHCQPGKGCAIWQNVPAKCADFYCRWRMDPQLGDEWRPDRAGFLISKASPYLPHEINVDPGKPDAWRKEPYYSALKIAARSAVAEKMALIVLVGARHWIMLPDGDVAVPHGLENTDFRIYQETPLLGGAWKVTFLAQSAAH